MTATLPLQSCRMFASCLHRRRRRFGGNCQAEDRDRPGLWTAIEADPTPGATVAAIMRRMDAVMAQFRREFQALGRAGFHAQPASLALLDINSHFTSRWARHACHLISLSHRCGLRRMRILQPLCLFAILVQLRTEVG